MHLILGMETICHVRKQTTPQIIPGKKRRRNSLNICNVGHSRMSESLESIGEMIKVCYFHPRFPIID